MTRAAGMGATTRAGARGQARRAAHEQSYRPAKPRGVMVGPPGPAARPPARSAAIGRAAWPGEPEDHRRRLAATAFFRVKRIFGARLSSPPEERQATEGRSRGAARNRMPQRGLPARARGAAGGATRKREQCALLFPTARVMQQSQSRYGYTIPKGTLDRTIIPTLTAPAPVGACRSSAPVIAPPAVSLTPRSAL